MELKTLFGLPAHPLLVHLPVVLLPIAGIFAIFFVIRPAFLDKYGRHLVVLSGVGALGGILASGSGEGLAQLQNRPESHAREEHFEMGETARNMGILFFLIVLAVVVLRHMSKKQAGEAGFWKFVKSSTGAMVMSAALVLSAVGSTYAISVAGHQGAKLVWEDNGRE